MTDVQVLKPPSENHDMEKNWLFLNNDRFIYSWHPLTICSVDHVTSMTSEISRQDTPDFYSNVRGSTPPVKYDERLLVLTHEKISFDGQVLYRHCWQCLDPRTLKLVARSPTFHFFENFIMAFCLSCYLHAGPEGTELQLFVNIGDEKVWLLRCPAEAVMKQLRSPNEAFPEDDLDGFTQIQKGFL